MPSEVLHYFDYKSPYAYLAQEATFGLSEEPGVNVEWLPYTLHIPSFLGEAELDDSGQDVIGTRILDAHTDHEKVSKRELAACVERHVATVKGLLARTETRA